MLICAVPMELFYLAYSFRGLKSTVTISFEPMALFTPYQISAKHNRTVGSADIVTVDFNPRNSSTPSVLSHVVTRHLAYINSLKIYLSS